MARRKIPESDRQVYVLRLYVTGASAVSARAIANLKALCEQRLKGRFQLEVIDILQMHALAEGEHIVPAPTLVRVLPAPLRRFIGDLSDLDGKLFGLDAHPR
jgi:circadian clock protein KaiB